MNPSSSRRTFLLTIAALPFSTALPAWADRPHKHSAAKTQLAKIEKDLDGRLGVYALNIANGAQLGYRADERFPLCSTFKVLAASAILKKSEQMPGLLQQRVHYQKGDLVNYSPITEKHVDNGMIVAELCAAALQYSDNTAGNLLMKMLGGPQSVTEFARSIGNIKFRLDRWETELNTAIPGDLRDTATPRSMGHSLQRLTLGNALAPLQRQQLCSWLYGNTTGATRIKAGTPADWKIGDKTGTGDYGTGNDIAVLWPPKRNPIVVTIYTTRHKQDAKARNDIIATTAQVIVKWIG